MNVHYSHDMTSKPGPKQSFLYPLSEDGDVLLAEVEVAEALLVDAADAPTEQECFKCMLCTCHNEKELAMKCVPVVVPRRNNVAEEVLNGDRPYIFRLWPSTSRKISPSVVQTTLTEEAAALVAQANPDVIYFSKDAL